MSINSANPVFSIITVTYNAQKVLEKTIESVRSQTYPHIEYLIIDGGSSDNTLKIIERNKDCIQYVVSEPDKGIYDAMNKGIQAAKGDYLIFLNAGDCFFDSDTLMCVADQLYGSTLPDIIYGETAIVDYRGYFLHMRHLSAPRQLNWTSFKQGMLVCHQAFWVKRELAITEAYNLQYRYSADVDWCIRIMKKSARMLYTEQILINYLNEGTTTRHRLASLFERYRIMSVHYGAISTLKLHFGFVARLFRKQL